ncbi:DUF5704 domain-containing protein [Paenibacillus caui]|uniref:DUF5704 domain-containing protein n=1 Tax=Paenibacillus caui TaxID=2873927 RepID=UPI001F32F9D9|nr:DUF5704 domain-containing protein [Paenibacillus caui]
METGDPWPLDPYEGGYDYYINLYYEGAAPPDPEEPPPPESNCTTPTPTQSKEAQVMDPNVSAVIKADSRGAERFDVRDGIPTSESLYGNVIANNYLFHHKFVQMTGKCTINVTVTRDYNLTWDPGKEVTGPDGKTHTEPDPQQTTEQLSQSVTIERPYSFWVIDSLQVYNINEADLWNYAFASNGIKIFPSGYSSPYYSFSHTGGYTPPDVPDSIEAPPGSKSGGKEKPDISNEDLKPFAEKEIEKVKVQNDTFTFNGSTIMDGSERERTTPTPTQVPAPAPIGQNVLDSPGNMIPSSKVNKKDQPSSGTIYYGLMSPNIGGGADNSFSIDGINPVTVHTPVVIFPEITDDKAHNQKTKPDESRAALILDRPFTVTLPTEGKHNDYKGYGTRDYAKYTAYKQVMFEFDVYNADKSRYIQANTWIDIPVSQLEATFFMPVWVDEGPYTVHFRSIAENAPNGYSSGQQANLDWPDHAAVDSIDVEVIGRLYDFRITDITDYNWEGVFRRALGKLLASGASYWVGLRDIDGGYRGNVSPFKLPIYPGSHPDSAFKNVAVKTGYAFRFDFKTKGNMFSNQDEIHISPSFDYVSEDGRFRFPVDLYYHSGNQKFIKIGSEEDRVQRAVILNEPLRNVPETELIDSALYRYDREYGFGEIAAISREAFVAKFVNVFSKRRVTAGTYHSLLLTGDIRTLIGPKTEVPLSVDPQRAIAAVQKWYGEYSLPAEVYVAKQGTDLAEYGRTHGGLTDRSDIFLKKGYIIVNFDLESLPGGDAAHPRLQYIHAPLMNQWRLEGYERRVADYAGNVFSLKDGDVVFYHAGLSSRDDFRPLVTH